MIKTVIVLGLVFIHSILFTSCNGNKNDSSSSKSSSSNNGYDLSSPTSTINTLIKASSEQDEDGLSVCFSKQSASEFKSIVDKKLSKEDLKELKEMFGNAKIISSNIEGSRATVSIQLEMREENIMMVKENNDWVIVDF